VARLAGAAEPGAGSAVAAPVPVGIEGRLQILLEVPGLSPRPIDPKRPLVARVADSRPHGSLTEYDLRYVGFEPGTNDLRDYLTGADGAPISNLPPMLVVITSSLPARHDGMLIAPRPTTWERLGGYRTLLIAIAALWFLTSIPLFLIRRRPVAVSTPAEPPRLTLADRLRPLMERAAAGSIDAAEKAELERLVLAHWRERLGLEPLSMADAIRRVKEDPEGGAILRALEDWLHRPPGRATANLEVLLAPYRRSAPLS
jgi:hypothetical protein